jgi:Mn2+/Fe2+ NRAMP family transporter
MRVVSAWAVLVDSKFVILEAINMAFGDEVLFKGPYHGVVAFVAVIVVMLMAELTVVRIDKRLG